MLMITQSNIPRIKGLMPTARRVSIDSDAPMKNIVNVRKRLAMPDMMVPTCGTLSRVLLLQCISVLNIVSSFKAV